MPQAVTAEEIERESAVDDELETLRECIKTGRIPIALATSQSEISFAFLEVLY